MKIAALFVVKYVDGIIQVLQKSLHVYDSHNTSFDGTA